MQVKMMTAQLQSVSRAVPMAVLNLNANYEGSMRTAEQNKGRLPTLREFIINLTT